MNNMRFVAAALKRHTYSKNKYLTSVSLLPECCAGLLNYLPSLYWSVCPYGS